MNSPKITIAMPVYNGGNFLSKTLKNTISQTYKNIEIIISNNCSNDRTLEVINDFKKKDERIIVLNQESKLSSVENFKTIINYASGDYFVWLSHDDYFEKNYLESCIPYLNNDRAVFGSVQYIDEYDQKLSKIQNQKLFYFVGNKLTRKLKYIYYPSLSGKMILYWSIFPTKVLKKHYQELINYKGDIDYFDSPFVLCCLNSIKLISIGEIFFYKRNHRDSNSNDHAKDKKENVYFKLIKHLFLIKNFNAFISTLSFVETIFTILFLPLGFIYNFIGNVFFIIKFFINR